MSACQFDFHLPTTPQRLLRALRADFARFGGAVTGDDPGGETGFGEFALPTPLGEFTGTWEVTAAGPRACAVRIDIESKPMFVPCSAIEEHLDRRLTKAAASG